MREIRTEIEIAAPPTKVWNILTDFDNWKDWNPIGEASGVASPGSKLNVTMRYSDGKGRNKYSPVVTKLEEPKVFRWRGTMMAGFLFTNDKIFEIEEMGSGTRLTHIEAFSGILVFLFWGKMNESIPPMLNAMNEALKIKAEKSK